MQVVLIRLKETCLAASEERRRHQRALRPEATNRKMKVWQYIGAEQGKMTTGTELLTPNGVPPHPGTSTSPLVLT